MQLSLPFETADLRKPPYKDVPGIRSAYVHKSPPRMITADLPIGTQASFIAAAAAAASLGAPINILLTIRWRSLFCDNDVNPLRPLPTPERIHYILERLRKWLVRNGAPPFYIWVRENADNAGEHLHIAFHLPKQHQARLVPYIASLTGEPRRRRRSMAQATEGEFACGELGLWHLARDTRPDRGGFYLAAYLGKGEPSERLFRGKKVGNAKKPLRGTRFGGACKDGLYDIAQGKIEGSDSRRDRFFIANDLKLAAGFPSKAKTKGRARASSGS